MAGVRERGRRGVRAELEEMLRVARRSPPMRRPARTLRWVDLPTSGPYRSPEAVDRVGTCTCADLVVRYLNWLLGWCPARIEICAAPVGRRRWHVFLRVGAERVDPSALHGMRPLPDAVYEDERTERVVCA